MASVGGGQLLPKLELRVYAPIPEVVIVRVSGIVDRLTAPVLAGRVGYQLTRAPHVVVDLGEVTVLDPRGLAVLRTLHQQATANGSEIHLARAEHDAVRRGLRITGLDQLFTLVPTADTVIAACQAASRGGPDRNGPDRVELDGR